MKKIFMKLWQAWCNHSRQINAHLLVIVIILSVLLFSTWKTAKYWRVKASRQINEFSFSFPKDDAVMGGFNFSDMMQVYLSYRQFVGSKKAVSQPKLKDDEIMIQDTVTGETEIHKIKKK